MANSAPMIGETGLAYEHIYFNALHPEEKEVVRFLQIVTDPLRQPAFVHCKHGADRTGMMCAIYRVAGRAMTGEQKNSVDALLRAAASDPDLLDQR